MADRSVLYRGSFTVAAIERILFGQPAATAVAEEVARYGAARVFVITTRSLSTQRAGLCARLIDVLGARHAGTYAAVRAHSPREDVLAAARSARAAQADLLLAVGGGSVIDATKVVQLCLWLGIERDEELAPFRVGAPDSAWRGAVLPEAPIRAIAVSTTLSAAEFTAVAGITDLATRAKQAFSHRLFVPRSVILDPEATLETPAWLLYATGIRAVDHAVETYCAPSASPATEAHSLQGLHLLHRALPQIAAAPGDLAARLDAQVGMWQAMLPASSGVPTGASHGIGYVLGGTFGVPHGHTSCVMLPAVLRWNAEVNASRQRALSVAMGAPERAASALIAGLVSRLGQPHALGSVGISREHFDEIAQRALSYPAVRANPRPITSVEDVKAILELAT